MTFAASSGGNPSGLVTMGRTGTGLLTGSNTNTLGAMPGVGDSQTMPAYDPVLNELYAIQSAGPTVNKVSRVNGSLLGTVNLNLAAAGSPTLQGEFLGFDSFFDVFVTLDGPNDRALVFDGGGSFLGASQLSGFNPTQNSFNVGFANDQIFTFDQRINSWRGFDIFGAAPVPEPATLALIGLGLAGLGFSRRKQ